MKKFIKWLFELIFKNQLEELKNATSSAEIIRLKCMKQTQKLDQLFDNMDVSVDFHEYSKSWAVVSIQGEKTDYIKFVDLGKSDIREIGDFLSKFDRSKVDANPSQSLFLKSERFQ